MIDRIADLQGRVQRSRDALEALADRAAELRARLASYETDDGAAPGGGAAEGSDGTPEGGPAGGGEGAVASGPGSALVTSLDRLSHTATAATHSGADAASGDDGRFLSDAWEIALINEEGK